MRRGEAVKEGPGITSVSTKDVGERALDQLIVERGDDLDARAAGFRRRHERRGYGRKWLRELDGVRRVVVIDRVARLLGHLDHRYAAVLQDAEDDHESGRLVVAVAAREVLDAGIAPLLLDHPTDALEVVVELRIAGIERDRLALDPRPAFAGAPGAARPASTQCRSAVDQRRLWRHGRHPRLRRDRKSTRLNSSHL